MSKLIQFCTKIEELTFFVSNILTEKSTEQQKDDQPKAFLFVLALKTTNGLRTVNYLVAQAPEQLHLFDSVFILFRTLLSDSITYFYLMAKSLNAPDPDATLVEQIKVLDGDHIKYLDKNLKVYQKLYNDTDQKIGKMKSQIRQQYSDYFNQNGSYKYESVNIGGMVIEIVDSKIDFLVRVVNDAYDLYDTFSKLEHLGVLTLQLTTRQYYLERHQEIFKEIYGSIRASMLSLQFLLSPFLTTEQSKHYDRCFNEILAIKIYE